MSYREMMALWMVWVFATIGVSMTAGGLWHSMFGEWPSWVPPIFSTAGMSAFVVYVVRRLYAAKR